MPRNPYGGNRINMRAVAFREKTGPNLESRIHADAFSAAVGAAWASYGITRGLVASAASPNSSNIVLSVGEVLVGPAGGIPVYVQSGAEEQVTLPSAGSAARVDSVGVLVRDSATQSIADFVVIQGTPGAGIPNPSATYDQNDSEYFAPVAYVTRRAGDSNVQAADISSQASLQAVIKQPPEQASSGLLEIFNDYPASPIAGQVFMASVPGSSNFIDLGPNNNIYALDIDGDDIWLYTWSRLFGVRQQWIRRFNKSTGVEDLASAFSPLGISSSAFDSEAEVGGLAVDGSYLYVGPDQGSTNSLWRVRRSDLATHRLNLTGGGSQTERRPDSIALLGGQIAIVEQDTPGQDILVYDIPDFIPGGTGTSLTFDREIQLGGSAPAYTQDLAVRDDTMWALRTQTVGATGSVAIERVAGSEDLPSAQTANGFGLAVDDSYVYIATGTGVVRLAGSVPPVDGAIYRRNAANTAWNIVNNVGA